MTVFFRLLAMEDKGSGLADAVAGLAGGISCQTVYAVPPESFRQVPNAPFCYWVSDRIRQLFKLLPPFEGEGRTVKVGLQTGDDFRFVRAWWEVPAQRILDGGQWAVVRSHRAVSERTRTERRVREFQGWCRKRTHLGKPWVPFAKGGEYSPFYADIHLVANWECEGEEMKAFVGSVIRNPDYYFRSGLTWPLRTQRFGPRSLPRGCAFGHKGPASFVDDDSAESNFTELALVASRPFGALVELSLNAADATARSFEVGIIQRIPRPEPASLHEKRLAELAHLAWSLKRTLDTVSETSHAFLLPASLRGRVGDYDPPSAEAELASIQSEIDAITFDLYGFDDADRATVQQTAGGQGLDDADAEPDDDDWKDAALLDAHFALLSWCVGAAFGRFDARLAPAPGLGPAEPDPFQPLPVCPPGMLVGPAGLPAEPNRIVSEEWLRARPDANSLPPDGLVKRPIVHDGGYPLRISWSGILADDENHAEDIVARVREALDVIWKDRADAIEHEACELLGVKTLRDYFRRPSGFFADHLKRYSKSRRQAPIYWPLSTARGSYTLWVYCHRLTDQTLHTVLADFVGPKLKAVRAEISALRESGNHPNRLEEWLDLEKELADFHTEIERIIKLPWKPNLNDGVLITACPLWKLFRLPKWQRDLKTCWDKLEKGEYDWAHLAYSIWPKRVENVCKKDRSIAIAHDLEHLCQIAPSKPKVKRSRKETLVAVDSGPEYVPLSVQFPEGKSGQEDELEDQS